MVQYSILHIGSWQWDKYLSYLWINKFQSLTENYGKYIQTHEKTHLWSVLIKGMLAMDVIFDFLTIVTLNFAFESGSSKQGSAFRASTDSICVVAR